MFNLIASAKHKHITELVKIVAFKLDFPTPFLARFSVNFFNFIMQGAVGLAIWVAAVGNTKSHSSRESATQQGLLRRGPDELPSGLVWRRVEGPGTEIELVTLGSDDDPNGIYVLEEVLMNECQVCTSY